MPDTRLSEAEAYIMEWFWREGAMNTAQLSALVADKGWKATTLLTFLSRLAAKGMLAVEKLGKSNLYTPLVSRETYRLQEGMAFLEDMFGGSARSFLAAMADGKGLSADDMAELKSWLAQQEVDNG